MRHEHRRRLLTLILTLAVAFGLAAEPVTEDAPVVDRLRVVDQIGERLTGDMREKWIELRREFADDLQATEEVNDLYNLLNEMLERLGLSHHMIEPPGPEDAGDEMPEFDMGRGYIGMTVQLVDDRMLVVRVDSESPAAKAGIRPGFELVSVRGVQMREVVERLERHPGRLTQKRYFATDGVSALLSPPVGETVELVAVDGEGESREYVLEGLEAPGTTSQVGNLPPLTVRVEVRELDGELGYIHLSIFMPAVLPLFNSAIDRLRTKRGLILDLRGNPGGMGMLASPIAGKLVEERLSLGVSRMPDGEIRYPVFPQPAPYLGPVAILVDESTGSTAEILAAGLQEVGRALVVGRQTLGAVMPSMIIELENGAKLQYAVADFVTAGGTILEGRGVLPDLPVELTRDLLLSRGDAILQAAAAALLDLKATNPKDPP